MPFLNLQPTEVTEITLMDHDVLLNKNILFWSDFSCKNLFIQSTLDISNSERTGENIRDSQSSRYRETDLKQNFLL